MWPFLNPTIEVVTFRLCGYLLAKMTIQPHSGMVYAGCVAVAGIHLSWMWTSWSVLFECDQTHFSSKSDPPTFVNSWQCYPAAWRGRKDKQWSWLLLDRSDEAACHQIPAGGRAADIPSGMPVYQECNWCVSMMLILHFNLPGLWVWWMCNCKYSIELSIIAFLISALKNIFTIWIMFFSWENFSFYCSPCR